MLLFMRCAAPPNDGGGSNVVAVAVGVSVTLAIVLALCIVCYVKRKPLADWLLWKLGNFRFNRFRENEHGAGSGTDSASDRPVPLASSASAADQLTLSEPTLNAAGADGGVVVSSADHPSPTGAGAAGETAGLTLSSDTERLTGGGADNNPGVGHESFDALPPGGAHNPARDL